MLQWHYTPLTGDDEEEHSWRRVFSFLQKMSSASFRTTHSFLLSHFDFLVVFSVTLVFFSGGSRCQPPLLVVIAAIARHAPHVWFTRDAFGGKKQCWKLPQSIIPDVYRDSIACVNLQTKQQSVYLLATIHLESGGQWSDVTHPHHPTCGRALKLCASGLWTMKTVVFSHLKFKFHT